MSVNLPGIFKDTTLLIVLLIKVALEMLLKKSLRTLAIKMYE